MKTPGDVPYLGLYCPGHEIGRSFSNLVPKRTYFLSFYAAERRGYGEAELLTVKVNGHVVADKLSPLAEFTKHTYTFTPNDLGEAAVEFMNDIPRSSFRSEARLHTFTSEANTTTACCDSDRIARTT